MSVPLPPAAGGPPPADSIDELLGRLDPPTPQEAAPGVPIVQNSAIAHQIDQCRSTFQTAIKNLQAEQTSSVETAEESYDQCLKPYRESGLLALFKDSKNPADRLYIDSQQDGAITYWDSDSRLLNLSNPDADPLLGGGGEIYQPLQMGAHLVGYSQDSSLFFAEGMRKRALKQTLERQIIRLPFADQERVIGALLKTFAGTDLLKDADRKRLKETWSEFRRAEEKATDPAVKERMAIIRIRVALASCDDGFQKRRLPELAREIGRLMKDQGLTLDMAGLFGNRDFQSVEQPGGGRTISTDPTFDPTQEGETPALPTNEDQPIVGFIRRDDLNPHLNLDSFLGGYTSRQGDMERMGEEAKKALGGTGKDSQKTLQALMTKKGMGEQAARAYMSAVKDQLLSQINEQFGTNLYAGLVLPPAHFWQRSITLIKEISPSVGFSHYWQAAEAATNAPGSSVILKEAQLDQEGNVVGSVFRVYTTSRPLSAKDEFSLDKKAFAKEALKRRFREQLRDQDDDEGLDEILREMGSPLEVYGIVTAAPLFYDDPEDLNRQLMDLREDEYRRVQSYREDAPGDIYYRDRPILFAEKGASTFSRDGQIPEEARTSNSLAERERLKEISETKPEEAQRKVQQEAQRKTGLKALDRRALLEVALKRGDKESLLSLRPETLAEASVDERQKMIERVVEGGEIGEREQQFIATVFQTSESHSEDFDLSRWLDENPEVAVELKGQMGSDVEYQVPDSPELQTHRLNQRLSQLYQAAEGFRASRVTAALSGVGLNDLMPITTIDTVLQYVNDPKNKGRIDQDIQKRMAGHLPEFNAVIFEKQWINFSKGRSIDALIDGLKKKGLWKKVTDAYSMDDRIQFLERLRTLGAKQHSDVWEGLGSRSQNLHSLARGLFAIPETIWSVLPIGFNMVKDTVWGVVETGGRMVWGAGAWYVNHTADRSENRPILEGPDHIWSHHLTDGEVVKVLGGVAQIAGGLVAASYGLFRGYVLGDEENLAKLFLVSDGIIAQMTGKYNSLSDIGYSSEAFFNYGVGGLINGLFMYEMIPGTPNRFFGELNGLAPRLGRTLLGRERFGAEIFGPRLARVGLDGWLSSGAQWAGDSLLKPLGWKWKTGTYLFGSQLRTAEEVDQFVGQMRGLNKISKKMGEDVRFAAAFHGGALEGTTDLEVLAKGLGLRGMPARQSGMIMRHAFEIRRKLGRLSEVAEEMRNGGGSTREANRLADQVVTKYNDLFETLLGENPGILGGVKEWWTYGKRMGVVGLRGAGVAAKYGYRVSVAAARTPVGQVAIRGAKVAGRGAATVARWTAQRGPIQVAAGTTRLAVGTARLTARAGRWIGNTRPALWFGRETVATAKWIGDRPEKVARWAQWDRRKTGRDETFVSAEGTAGEIGPRQFLEIDADQRAALREVLEANRDHVAGDYTFRSSLNGTWNPLEWDWFGTAWSKNRHIFDGKAGADLGPIEQAKVTVRVDALKRATDRFEAMLDEYDGRIFTRDSELFVKKVVGRWLGNGLTRLDEGKAAEFKGLYDEMIARQREVQEALDQGNGVRWRGLDPVTEWGEAAWAEATRPREVAAPAGAATLDGALAAAGTPLLFREWMPPHVEATHAAFLGLQDGDYTQTDLNWALRVKNVEFHPDRDARDPSNAARREAANEAYAQLMAHLNYLEWMRNGRIGEAPHVWSGDGYNVEGQKSPAEEEASSVVTPDQSLILPPDFGSRTPEGGLILFGGNRSPGGLILPN